MRDRVPGMPPIPSEAGRMWVRFFNPIFRGAWRARFLGRRSFLIVRETWARQAPRARQARLAKMKLPTSPAFLASLASLARRTRTLHEIRSFLPAISPCLHTLAQASRQTVAAVRCTTKEWTRPIRKIEKALKCNKDEQRHDRVRTRKKMVERLLDDPRLVDHEIDQAMGCAVTNDEHDSLTGFDTTCDGWERYNKARIRVWDLKENTRISDAWK